MFGGSTAEPLASAVAPGEIIVSPNKYLQPHPAIAIMESAESTCTKCLIQFGLTPAARKKIDINRKSNSAEKWKGLVG